MSKETDELMSTEIFPFFPFLVLINTTPFAALYPQRAAAEAPFSTCTLSMSFGLISFNLLCWPTPSVPLPISSFETGVPSITNNGCVDPVIEFCPLIWM